MPRKDNPEWLRSAALIWFTDQAEVIQRSRVRQNGGTAGHNSSPRRPLYTRNYLDRGRIQSLHFSEGATGSGDTKHAPNTGEQIDLSCRRRLPVGYQLIEFHHDPESRLKAAVFRKSGERGEPSKMVICFPGNQGKLPDFMEIGKLVFNGFKMSRLFDQSKLLVEEVKRTNPEAEIEIIGHSLGGAQATWAAIQMDLPAHIINGAPVPDEKLPDEVKITRRGRVVAIKGEKKICNINVVGCWVSSLWGREGDFTPSHAPGVQASQIGRRHTLPFDVHKLNIEKTDRLRGILRRIVQTVNRGHPDLRGHGDRQSEVKLLFLAAQNASKEPAILHHPATVMIVLAARQIHQGMDPRTVLGIDLTTFLAEAPIAEQMPLSEQAQRVLEMGKSPRGRIRSTLHDAGSYVRRGLVRRGR
ncbi:MAG TPA: YqiA/YcfP family alpha/beta fold hydrolase [Chthoniobacterales bacterium]